MEPFPDPQSDPGGTDRSLERTHSRALCALRFELAWESDGARHRDCLVSEKINLWRDIFPPELEVQIMDRPTGHRAVHAFAPGELLPPWREAGLHRARNDQFNRRFLERGYVQPRAGRFYPKGILEGLPDVFRSDLNPFRLAELDGDRLLADFNHPLADKALELAVEILSVREPGEERGGRCNEIGDLVSAGGPGMQGRWRDRPTDFWSDMPFLRQDPRPDPEFYAQARMVDHLDRTALAQVSGLYGRLIPNGARILDLMASHDSHLPAALAPAAVTGLGLNQAELDANPALTERLVHDLNQDPRLSFADGSFDAVVCTVSVEYLTQPFEVFAEVARVLRPGGRFLVTFSNRWFPPKAVRIWEAVHEFERPGLVLELFHRDGLFRDLNTWSLRGLPRPRDDKYADRLAFSDPVFAVWGERA